MPSDPQDWLDQRWYAGYCDETVRRCSETALNSGGSKQRLEWMQKHTPECMDCLYANFMKNPEAAIAEELGFLEEFMSGGDVTAETGVRRETVSPSRREDGRRGHRPRRARVEGPRRRASREAVARPRAVATRPRARAVRTTP